jgi:hypothetical protein
MDGGMGTRHDREAILLHYSHSGGASHGGQENSVLKVVAVDFAGKDAVLQGMRRTATDLHKVYLQLETVSKYGFKIAEKFFDRKSSVQVLTDEQEKLLLIIKEESREAATDTAAREKVTTADGVHQAESQANGADSNKRRGNHFSSRNKKEEAKW